MDVEVVEQLSAKLGRQQVHDPRSRAFPMIGAVDRTTWKDRVIRLYDPYPNPEQAVGCCTGVAKCSQFNSVGNRVSGVVLNMKMAELVYSMNTTRDPFPGTWPPTDTGSSGLASCQSAQELGLGGEYRWLFGGADEVVQNIVEGRVISAGTWWYWDMFHGATRYQRLPVITPTGGQAGGHQYVLRGYHKGADLVLGRCWWGQFRDFWIKRTHLDTLLRDGGDAHWQERKKP